MPTTLNRMQIQIKNPNPQPGEDEWLDLGVLGADIDHVRELIASVVADASNMMVNKGILPDGSDLDSINTNSVYFLRTNYTYPHKPTSMPNYGFITTKITGIIVQQTIETNDSIYLRRFDGSIWSTWVKK